jgi:hypothetical protein
VHLQNTSYINKYVGFFAALEPCLHNCKKKKNGQGLGFTWSNVQIGMSAQNKLIVRKPK